MDYSKFFHCNKIKCLLGLLAWLTTARAIQVVSPSIFIMGYWWMWKKVCMNEASSPLSFNAPWYGERGMELIPSKVGPVLSYMLESVPISTWIRRRKMPLIGPTNYNWKPFMWCRMEVTTASFNLTVPILLRCKFYSLGRCNGVLWLHTNALNKWMQGQRNCFSH